MTELIDSFIIGAYWGSRAEPLLQIVQKTSLTLLELRDIDNQFLKYYRGGVSRKAALKHEICLDNESIKKLCLTNIKGDKLPENGISKNRYIFGAWTGQKDEESSYISFIVGDTFDTTNISNCCVIGIPHEGSARDRLLQLATSKRILGMLVKNWSPDCAVLSSTLLRKKLNVGLEIGWMTFKQKIKHVPKLGNGIVYEKNEQGHWFYVKPIGSYTDDVANQLLPLKKML